MSKNFLVALAVGAVLIVAIVGGVLVMQRGARVGLTGNVLKVRTAPLDEHHSVAVLDFRFTNPSNVRFVVRSVTVVLDDADGKLYDGRTVAEMDARRLFEAIPLLGQKFNDTLLIRDAIPPRASADKMIAASFEAPESRLEKRRRFLIRIEDVDGPVTEFSEK